MSPLLFDRVMDVLTVDVRYGSLMELLYADDLVLSGKLLKEVLYKYERWKKAKFLKLRECLCESGCPILLGHPDL